MIPGVEQAQLGGAGRGFLAAGRGELAEHRGDVTVNRAASGAKPPCNTRDRCCWYTDRVIVR